jgi:hypothetical protein
MGRSDEKTTVAVVALAVDMDKRRDSSWNGNSAIGDRDLAAYPIQISREICERYRESIICGLDEKDATPCKLHKAKEDKYDDEWGSPNIMFIIRKPIYDSLDDAAMAAANIIRYHIRKRGDVEYSISIYGNDDINEYCLVETRQGTRFEVRSDYNLGSSYGYSFKADVHSHPIFDIQEFTKEDYILSCGGELYNNDGLFLNRFVRPSHVKFLAGIQNVWSRNHVYEKGELVIYGGKRWIAKTKPSAGGEPTDGCSGWVKVEECNNKCNECKKDDGAIVFDRTQDHLFWERKASQNECVRHNGWIQHYCSHGPETLTKFTPPALGEDIQDNLYSKTKMLAIIMAALSNHYKCLPLWNETIWATLWPTLRNTFPFRYQVPVPPGDYNWTNIKKTIRDAFLQRIEYGILEDFKGKLQQTNILEKWDLREKWENRWKPYPFQP